MSKNIVFTELVRIYKTHEQDPHGHSAKYIQQYKLDTLHSNLKGADTMTKQKNVWSFIDWPIAALWFSIYQRNQARHRLKSMSQHLRQCSEHDIPPL